MDRDNVDTFAVKIKYNNIMAFIYNVWGKSLTFLLMAFSNSFK